MALHLSILHFPLSSSLPRRIGPASAPATPLPLDRRGLGFSNGELGATKLLRSARGFARVRATADGGVRKMNLNEYMVTLEKPLGIRFALSLDGKIFVHALRKGLLINDAILRAKCVDSDTG